MRLFLALIPPPELRRQLGQLGDAAHAPCGGRRIVDDNLHLTLAFLGERSAAEAESLSRWLERQVFGAGQWRLDRWGYFAGPRIIWVGGPGSAELQRRQASLVASLKGFGIVVQPRQFRPHISLLRNASPPPDTDLPKVGLDWSYARVSLVSSVPTPHGSRYTTLAQSRPQDDAFSGK
ncbi:RNA 2',3'-cyclic phosphodiesterase [Halomonas almeriensis]|uniref:RNA 2',3'-cyclic phosphodiesterase n=1 Tax=Halomonas almeriensis TaxID=308163 RepID=UPI0025B40502|nr:RNA 2',3'-cyclic phosphodiesterase [Halomonas almeriensis]MDN3552563.1 RNA 2',3'-cyclic phosphodiesterase [Halomonas almeriensis]